MKVQGTYESVVKGVSQQAPADRLEGQHAEVVNMISDPVRGLVRRNGFVMESQWLDPLPDTVTAAQREEAIEDGGAFRCFPFRQNGIDYDILWRSRPVYSSTGKVHRAHMYPVMCYSREYDQEQFLPLVGRTKDNSIDPYLEGGFSAVTSVGQYILLAGNTVSCSYVSRDLWNTPANQSTPVVWIRGGGNSRTYTISVTLKSNSQTYTYTYTTPPLQYPGALDFSTITEDPSTPEYTAAVNKVQGDYDTAVNQHIAEAAAAIVPAAIAEKLREGLQALLPNPDSVHRWESTLMLEDIEAISCSDGANGEFLQETFTTVTSPDKLPIVCYYNKIVKIQPPGADPYYMESFQVGRSTSLLPYGRVQWRESRGETQEPNMGIALGRIHAGRFFIADTPEHMDELIFDTLGEVADTPKWQASKVGDLTTNPPPAFMSQRITMLGMFQDRLIIGAGGKVIASQQGEYFNFYRTTTLAIPDTDPWTAAAEGAQDDTIRKTTLHERNLFVHGDRKHYVIPGTSPQTPTTVSMHLMWAVDNAANCQPVSNGANLFIAKTEEQVGAGRLLQVQPGLYQDIPQLQDVSQQLRDYVNGHPAEVAAFLNPGVVFIRTEHVTKSKYGFPRSRPYGIYMYQYTDSGDTRLVDSWQAWEWSELFGRCVGMATAGFGDTLRLYMLTFARDHTGQLCRVVSAQRASIRPEPTGLPYLDGLTKSEEAEASGCMTAQASWEWQAQIRTTPGAQFSFEVPVLSHDPDKVIPPGPNWSAGDERPEVIDPLRWAGVQGRLTEFEDAYGFQSKARKQSIFTGIGFNAYVELTSPFIRAQDGKADTMGRLKITRLHVITTRTAGFKASWKDYDGQEVVLKYDQEYSQINYKQSVFVGRDARHVQIRLASEEWMPLTINGISWQGNYFGEERQV